MNLIIKAVLWIIYLISLYFAVFWFIVLIDNEQKPRRKKHKEKPFVSIVIPAYNEEKRIKATVMSILGLDYPRDKIELIVVNDGSKDNTVKVVKKIISENHHFDIRLISQSNKGKGAALNNGMRNCKGEFFVCFDADSFVEENALNIMLPYFAEDNVAAVLPIIKVAKPKNLLQRMQWFEYNVNMFYKYLLGRLDCIHVLPGPFSVYKKSILKKVGGFDENHNLTEDLEMALRLQKNSYKIIQLKSPTVTTIAPDNFKALYKQRNRWYKGSVLNVVKYRGMLLNKKYGDFGLFQLPIVLISGLMTLVMMLAIIYYTLKPYVKGLYNMSFVGFDFMTFIRNYTFHFDILEINYLMLFVSLVIFILSIYILSKSHSFFEERYMKFGMLSVILYVTSYFFILGVVWIGIAADLIRGKKQKW